MKVTQNRFSGNGWQKPLTGQQHAHWVLLFGNAECLRDQSCYQDIRTAFPDAQVIGCTTAGEIEGIELYDDTLCLTAVEFDRTELSSFSVSINDFDSSEAAGESLAKQIHPDGLQHVFVLSDGHLVNGSQLVQGLIKNLAPEVLVTGGLAADGDRFNQTWVRHNDKVEAGLIVVCALYGNGLQISHGCIGGWDTFGPDRRITKSKDNILYELDNQSALGLYKSYLGDVANELPASALLFPLQVRRDNDNEGVVRTILDINEADQSLIFAGDMPEGSYARLMRANFERVIDGAGKAAEMTNAGLAEAKPDLAILISCVGRRLVLKQRAEEELDATAEVLGENCYYTGFYSYGEISPLLKNNQCELHNQTMTITGFSEK